MKNIKVAAIIMSLCMAGAALCACNNQPEPVSSDINVISSQNQNQGGAGESNISVDPNAADNNFKITYKGIDITVNGELDDSKFDDNEYDVREQTSCAGQGLALVYSFKGGSFEVETFPDTTVVSRIKLNDDTVTTAEGVYIGNTMDQVKAVYGEPTALSENIFSYKKGSSELRLFVEDPADGKVSSIEYFSDLV